MDFGLGYLWVGDGGCLWILVWVIFGSAAEVWVLVWIGCGSMMEVCDFSLGRWWRFVILFWISEVGLLWFEQRFCGFAVV